MAVNLTREILIGWGYDPDLLDRLIAESESRPGIAGTGPPCDLLVKGGVIGRPTANRRSRAKPSAEPITSEVVLASEGRWVIRLSGWVPASDNLRAQGHWKWYGAKKRDVKVIAEYVCPFVPNATCKRRIGLLVQKRRGKLWDGQNLLKSYLDACVNNGLLIDDDGKGSEPTIPLVELVGDLPCRVRSTIGIEDIE